MHCLLCLVASSIEHQYRSETTSGTQPRDSTLLDGAAGDLGKPHHVLALILSADS